LKKRKNSEVGSCVLIDVLAQHMPVGLRKITESPSKESRYFGLDSNLWLPEYKSEALPPGTLIVVLPYTEAANFKFGTYVEAPGLCRWSAERIISLSIFQRVMDVHVLSNQKLRTLTNVT
jgi:hypothetical protein